MEILEVVLYGYFYSREKEKKKKALPVSNEEWNVVLVARLLQSCK